ncbi:hypothetical protein QA649_37735 [Bradyrhizobium sp. CB1717]|nr:hypothetical protein [Bradyrhizobium sp. CB1717]WFU23691.1 hypothetical protein QA649_37735 [Bradyrhizobium sp. CB1717]
MIKDIFRVAPVEDIRSVSSVDDNERGLFNRRIRRPAMGAALSQ